MNLKTYQANSMSDALADVKRDLGRDAVILHTRSFRKGGFLGLGGRHMWEITAAPNLNVPARGSRGQYVPTHPAAEEEVADIVELQDGLPGVLPLTDDGLADNGRSFVSQQMTELRRLVESLVARQGAGAPSDIPAELADFHTHLVAQDVAGQVADDLIRQLRMNLTGQQLGDRANIRQQLAELVASLIPVAPPDAPPAQGHGKVIALIGPTGVGKTTTIAKLAANLKLREGKRVGLITIDTYRIAAVDQLRTYAEIIDVPLQTVLTAGELHQTVQSMRDPDVVLLDTAGRSQNDRLRLSQLRSFLGAAGADEVHLVISSTANRKCVLDTLERFIPLGANRVIMTKLDEAATFGSILNVATAGKVPLSYVTAGQDVPEDILPADARQIAGWVMNGAMPEGTYAS